MEFKFRVFRTSSVFELETIATTMSVHCPMRWKASGLFFFPLFFPSFLFERAVGVRDVYTDFQGITLRGILLELGGSSRGLLSQFKS